MIIACACGGVFETLFFALAGIVTWTIMKLRSR